MPNTFLTLKSWVLYLFWQWCLSKLQYIEFENMYHSSFSYDLKRRYVEKNCHLIQFVPRLFIKSLVGDKLDFYLLTIWLCHHTNWSGVKHFLKECYFHSPIVTHKIIGDTFLWNRKCDFGWSWAGWQSWKKLGRSWATFEVNFFHVFMGIFFQILHT